MHTNRIFFTPAVRQPFVFGRPPRPLPESTHGRAVGLSEKSTDANMFGLSRRPRLIAEPNKRASHLPCGRQRGRIRAARKKEIERNNQSIAFRLGYSITLIVGSAAVHGGGEDSCEGSSENWVPEPEYGKSRWIMSCGFLLLVVIFAYFIRSFQSCCDVGMEQYSNKRLLKINVVVNISLAIFLMFNLSFPIVICNNSCYILIHIKISYSFLNKTELKLY